VLRYVFVFCVSFSGEVGMDVTRELGKVSASAVGIGLPRLIHQPRILFNLPFIVT